MSLAARHTDVVSLDHVAPDPAVPIAPEVPGYELGELLGRGGLGTVWAATRVADGCRVAVKVVPVAEPEQAHALARELAVLGGVEVEGLVGFHEAVGLDTDPPAAALVLDLLGGGSLERAVRARGHLSVGESVTVLAPVARAVAGLHARGVVHGDVTPANVLLELSGRAFLADLGVARLAGEVLEGQSARVWGTEGFVAPEVLDGEAVTTAADVYAVGALAWWCVTGEAPAHGAVRLPLAEVAPGLPAAWSEVTTQALLGDPARRPTAAELVLAYYDSAPCEPLRLVVGKDETSLLTQRLRRPAVTPDEPLGRGRWTAAAAHLRGRTGALATLAALVTVLGVGGLAAAGVVPSPGWVGIEGRDPGGTKAGGATTTTCTTSTGPRTTGPRTTGPTTSGTTTTGTTTTGTTTTGTTTTGRDAGPTRAGSVTPDTVDPASDRTAPAGDAHALMVALSSLRAEAMNSRSPRLVAELDAPASGALAQDTALLADLTASGTTWQGVRFEVSDARTVAHAGTTATIDAVVGTAAYRVVEATGQVATRAAMAGVPMRFELLWSGGRWRVDRVSAPASQR